MIGWALLALTLPSPVLLTEALWWPWSLSLSTREHQLLQGRVTVKGHSVLSEQLDQPFLEDPGSAVTPGCSFLLPWNSPVPWNHFLSQEQPRDTHTGLRTAWGRRT
ncbi:hypothetical protein CB1_002805003 [Camelus ferus]|nr:hypothetical protein CB1_002805003 [Camelus ferus]